MPQHCAQLRVIPKIYILNINVNIYKRGNEGRRAQNKGVFGFNRVTSERQPARLRILLIYLYN